MNKCTGVLTLEFGCSTEECSYREGVSITLTETPLPLKNDFEIEEVLRYLPKTWGIINMKAYCPKCTILKSKEATGIQVYEEMVGWRDPVDGRKEKSTIGLKIFNYLHNGQEYNEKELLQIFEEGSISDNLELTRKVIAVQKLKATIAKIKSDESKKEESLF